MNAYQQTGALKTAIELDLFSAISEGNTTPDALARRCAVAPRGARILCDFFVVHGFLTKTNGNYGLTQDSAVFLDRKSPACVLDAARFLASDDLVSHFRNLTDVVRQGGTVRSKMGSMEPNHPMWVDFARGMVPLMALPAELIAKHLALDPAREWRILDIAAGHGIFGIRIAQAAPRARVTAIDWPAVLEVALENAASAGVANRYETIPGSAFEVEYGTGYDVVLLTNFLHHFDHATNVTLLRKVFAALKPGGVAATLEFVPNDDRISPPESATFSMMMLGSTPAGDAYTFAELDKMFREAGFGESRIIGLHPSPEHLVISKKD